jgi:hypothetical protein
VLIKPRDEQLWRRTDFGNDGSHLGSMCPGWNEIGPHEIFGIQIGRKGFPKLNRSLTKLGHIDSIVDDGDFHL